MAGSDFVFVQLTQAGTELAGGHPLTVSNGKRSFTFMPPKGEAAAVPLRVEKSYEWNGVLSKQHTPLGLPMFELVADPAAPAAATAATAATTATAAAPKPQIVPSPAPKETK